MSMPNYWNKIVESGVNSEQALTYSDKLQARNRLSFFCIIFSLIYVVYFLLNGLFIPFLAIAFGIILFAASIVLNHFKKHTLSSLLILFNTNYCVLFFSIYLGFGSGIHLYLFTSPLIVLTLFDTKKIGFIILAMMSYVVTFITILLIDKTFKIDFLILNTLERDFFYIINFIFSSFILMSLALYFLYNNNKVNQLLLQTNKQLLFQQELLKKENITRKKAEEQALSSLNHREILLSEIHHRVKNNLAIVTALIELQTFYIEDQNTVQILKESQHRIKSIALLHEKLYENTSLKNVDVSSYTSELINFIKHSLSNKDKTIKIHSTVEKINLEMEQAMPFGLLLNELITNSYKHAFNNKAAGNIWLSLNEEGSYYTFRYEDDGSGFETNKDTPIKTLGLNLIESFCTQLNGIHSYKTIDNKMVFEFEFPTLKQ